MEPTRSLQDVSLLGAGERGKTGGFILIVTTESGAVLGIILSRRSSYVCGGRICRIISEVTYVESVIPGEFFGRLM